jgi:aminoglycoside phosphotransferase (APT) family kinase protein
MNPTVSRNSAVAAPIATTPGDDLDAAFVAGWLCKRLGCDAVRMTELVKFPRGVSRETWFLSCEWTRGNDTGTDRLILRRDLSSGSICLGELRAEYEIYRRLGQSGVPVAETLWYEDEPRELVGHREFFVRRHVDGDWNVPNLFDPDARFNRLRIDIGREHVRKLALVHGCDWRALGFDEILDVPPSPADSARCRIEAVTREIDRFAVEPLPLVAEAVEWFLAHQPSGGERICLIKGTNGFGEEVFRNGEIVALSDWELCCLGDPAMDFALAQTFFDDVIEDGKQLWGMQPALDYYRQLTGQVIAPQAVDYYKRLYGLYRVQYSQAAAHQLESGDKLCRLAWLSAEVLQLGQRALANAIGCTNTEIPRMGQR